MQVNPHLEIEITTPAYDLLQLCESVSLDVWFAALGLECPEANRDSDVGQPSVLDLLEVVLDKECLEVVVYHGLCLAVVLVLTECPLIDDGWITGVVEDRRSDPRLEDKQATNIDLLERQSTTYPNEEHLSLL